MDVATLDRKAQALFVALGHSVPGKCDGSLDKCRSIFDAPTVEQIRSHGGYCDCEFFFNAIDHMFLAALTASQKHEVAKIESDDSCRIVESPMPWNDTTGAIPAGSVSLTYLAGSTHVEIILEPDGTRHVVR